MAAAATITQTIGANRIAYGSSGFRDNACIVKWTNFGLKALSPTIEPPDRARRQRRQRPGGGDRLTTRRGVGRLVIIGSIHLTYFHMTDNVYT